MGMAMPVPGPRTDLPQWATFARRTPPRVSRLPAKARVQWVKPDTDDPWDLERWHWSVYHYEDIAGSGRNHVMTRWGRCTRWTDALHAGLAALANEAREES